MAETINKKRVYTELVVGQKSYNYTLAATGVPYYEYDCDDNIADQDAWDEWEALCTAAAAAAAAGDFVAFPAPISSDTISYNMMVTDTDNPDLSIRKYIKILGAQVCSVDLVEMPWRSLPIR